MITKELKHIKFDWDEDKGFHIMTFLGDEVYINRFYALSFVRFVLRIYARYFYAKKYEKNN